MASIRCQCGLHKWSKWDAFHRWCLRCGKVELTPIGKRVEAAAFAELDRAKVAAFAEYDRAMAEYDRAMAAKQENK